MSLMNSWLGFLVYVVFGSIGLGYFVYGRKQKMIVPLFSGVSLMIYPWFVTSHVLLVIIGVVLLALPYFLRY